MKVLAFYAGGSLSELRLLHTAGARVVLWNEDKAPELERAGIAFTPVSSYLDSAERERIDQVAIEWTKSFGRKAILGGLTLRELLAWGRHSLWWWAELYLHHSTEAPRYVRLIESFNRVLEAEAPEEVHALGLEAEDALLLSRACTAWRMLYEGPVPRVSRAWAVRRVSWHSRWNTLKTLGTALKASLSGRAPRPQQGDERTLLFLSHAAFWRERRDPETDAWAQYEHYFDRIVPDTAAEPDLRPFVVAVGPEAAFRRRTRLQRTREWLRLKADAPQYVHVNRYTRLGVFRRTWLGTRLMRRAWRELRRSPGVREALAHAGVSFADLTADGFAATLLLQLPWAVRSYEESAAMLRAVEPALLVLYAESSGWGRAALAAARDAGVPSVALQHGILYPTYYSYLHAPDEADCPKPTRTAVFGTAARDFLVSRGGYAADTLVLTGSPKFDDLLKAAAAWDRDALRARLGVGAGERLLLLASRFRGIRSTHQAAGSAFPALVRAVESLPGVQLVVKPHPAEPAAPYEAAIRDAAAKRVRVVAPQADLMELLHAADALVTVESLSAVEALALDKPVLVLNMPSNLRDLVEAGAALGVGLGQDPRPALEAVLFDAATRARLGAARARYLAAVAGGLDGQATARIVRLLRATAATSPRGSA
jgi:CDP-Glycerol:Poly(glycerophosphate) glycerophosphotransferase